MKDKKIAIGIIVLVVVLLLTITATYAYFQITAQSSGTQQSVTAKTATLSTTYEQGQGVNLVNEELIADQDIYIPLAVSNAGTVAQNFNIVWASITSTLPTTTTIGEDTVDVRNDIKWKLYSLTAAFDTTTKSLANGTLIGKGYLADATNAAALSTTTPLTVNAATGATPTVNYYVVHINVKVLTTDETPTDIDGVAAARTSNLQNYLLNKTFEGIVTVTNVNPLDN